MLHTTIDQDQPITGSNFQFKNTRKGPLVQFVDPVHGLICLLRALPETPCAKFIRDSHIRTFRALYDKTNPKESFQAVTDAQVEWRNKQTWELTAGIVYMNGDPAYRLIDNSVRVNDTWFEFHTNYVESVDDVTELNEFSTSVEEFLNSYIDTLVGTAQHIDWFRQSQVQLVEAIVSQREAVA